MTQAAGAGGWAIAPDGRAATVEAARRRWAANLVDHSRHNHLLYFRPLPLGTFELVEPHQLSLHQLVAGVRTPLSRLLPGQDLIRPVDEMELATHPERVDVDRLGVVRRLEEIRRRATENFEEHGLETMCLAYGLATWEPSDGGRPPLAPLVLVPIRLEARGERMALQRRADPELNLALLHLLAEYGCPPIDERLVSQLDDCDTADVGRILSGILAALAACAGPAIAGFTASPRAVIGNFSSEKLATVRDLDALAPRLPAHDVVAALAGDAAACTTLAAGRRTVDPATLDGVDPDTEFLPFESDSSQRLAIGEVLEGRSVVISGPPGTGKSQTIANLVAALAAAGRSVLVVSSKSAALEVVCRRLEQAGLGQLVLDLHGSVTKREVMAQFAASIEMVRESTPVDPGRQHQELVRRRELLVAHAVRMNRPVAPAALSVHRLLGLLMLASPASRSPLRLEPSTLAQLSPQRSAEIEQLLAAGAAVEDLVLGTSRSPWAGAQLLTDEAATRALTAATSLDAEWPRCAQALDAVLGETRLRRPAHLLEVTPLVEMVGLAGQLMETYSPALWELDLDEMLAAITLGLGQGLVKLVTRATHGQYKRAHQSLVARRTGAAAAAAGDPDEIPAEFLHAEVLDAVRVRDVWRVDGETGVSPRGAAWLPNLRAAVTACLASVPDLQSGFPGGDIREYPLHALPALIAGLAGDRETVRRVPLHCRTMARLGELGLQPLLDLLLAEQRPASIWVESFQTALWQSMLDGAWVADPGLASFDGDTQEQLVTQFSRLDRDRLALAGARVRRAHAENAVTMMNHRGDQHALVLQETAKRVDHISVRGLLVDAGDVLTALKPCWIASPLAVSQLLDGSREYFDVVVVDEASQLPVEEAVAALARGRTCVVIGDEHQLGPRSFTVAGGSPDHLDGAEQGETRPQSVLSAMSSVIRPWRLQWHYRSTDERLVAFTNARVYSGSMITFPGPRAESPLRLVRVDPATTPDPDGLVESSAAEIAMVVQLVRDHVAERGPQSLMVVALGRLHADRIEAALRSARDADEELDHWCDRTHVEPFCVRSADRVQGDERDHVILSVGWRSTDAADRDGPLLGPDGARLLTVALTRQRHGLTVVAMPTTGDPGGVTGTDPGLALLTDLLACCAAGGVDPATGMPLVAAEPPQPDELERDLAAALRAGGLAVTELLGTSRTRVDIALGHPRRQGVLVLALEGDGGAYAAAPTARDRDRLRRQQLEAGGWTHARIWGLEWYLRREATLARILEQHGAAVQRWEMRERGELEIPPADPAAPPGAAVVAPQRGERPSVPRGRMITDYTPHQIWQVMTWVLSDGRMRTDDEIVDATATELGFPRVDAWVDGPIRAVLRPPG